MSEKLKFDKNEYNKKYYQQNKERVKEKVTVPVECECCNKMIQLREMKRHKTSYKCLRARHEKDIRIN